MRNLIVATIILIIALSGCAGSVPLPVSDSSSPKSLPFDSSSFDKVKALFKGYYLTYLDEAKSKRLNAQGASETTFYSSIVAVIGGVIGSASTAIAGGTVGAGAGLYSDRYKQLVQATNYETASDAMFCMYLASQDITDNGLDHSQISMKDLTGNDATAAYVAREIATNGFMAVRNKIYRLQSTLELGQPDLGKLKGALSGQPQPVSSVPAIGTMSLTDDAEGRIAKDQLPSYKSKIDLCVSKITG